jgi:hypothetical protein
VHTDFVRLARGTATRNVSECERIRIAVQHYWIIVPIARLYKSLTTPNHILYGRSPLIEALAPDRHEGLYDDRSGSPDTFKLEICMKVEELIGSKVWIKIDQFRSVPGKIESMSNAVNLDDIKSSVSQSTFRIEMPSGNIIEILGSDISKIEHAD